MRLIIGDGTACSSVLFGRIGDHLALVDAKRRLPEQFVGMLALNRIVLTIFVVVLLADPFHSVARRGAIRRVKFQRLICRFLLLVLMLRATRHDLRDEETGGVPVVPVASSLVHDGLLQGNTHVRSLHFCHF